MIPEELFPLVCPNSSPRSSPYVLRGIEAIHALHPEWLDEVRDAIVSGASSGADFEWIFKAISGSTERDKRENLMLYRMWLRLHLTTLPLVTRYRMIEPDLRIIHTSGTSRHTLQVTGILDPTEDQMNAAAIFALIIRQVEKKPTADDINYIAGRLDEVEPLIPELRKRRAFDKESIEMLLGSSVVALRDGEL